MPHVDVRKFEFRITKFDFLNKTLYKSNFDSIKYSLVINDIRSNVWCNHCRTKKLFPIQIDGEPWKQAPATVSVYSFPVSFETSVILALSPLPHSWLKMLRNSTSLLTFYGFYIIDTNLTFQPSPNASRTIAIKEGIFLKTKNGSRARPGHRTLKVIEAERTS